MIVIEPPMPGSRPLLACEQTHIEAAGMSALGQKRTSVTRLRRTDPIALEGP